jgi:uncharacterized protein YjbI with pentapeptide repeats
VFVFPKLFAPSRPPEQLKDITDPEELIRLDDERIKLQNDIRTALLQAFGGAAVLAGIFFTWQQLQNDRQQLQDELTLTRQGQIASRFTEAIGQFGSKEPDIRIGGIYGLEAIAKQSPETRLQVFEVLTAYLRKYAYKYDLHPPSSRPSAAPTSTTLKAPTSTTLTGPTITTLVNPDEDRTTDIQIVMVVLSRRDVMPSDPYLNLRSVNLSGMSLHGMNLTKMDLSDARLTDLVNANLAGAILGGADLTAADLSGAHLEGADLRNSTLEFAILENAHLEKANLAGAILREARLINTNLEGANLQNADLRAVVVDRTNLSGTHLEQACLHGAELAYSNLRQAVLKGARAGEYVKDPQAVTTWPNGFDWRGAGVAINECPWLIVGYNS